MSLGPLAAEVTAVIALLTALGWGGRRLWRFLRLSVHAFETIVGDDKRPGLAGRLELVEKQLQPNGGGTLRDSINRIETRVDEIDTSARQAVTAAGLAVNEAKAGRAVMEEADARNRADIARANTNTDALAAALSDDARERHVKEVAYIKALQRLGLDLRPITDALDEEDDG